MFYKSLITIFTFVLISAQLIAQRGQFQLYGNDEGLVVDQINCLFQDSRGILWIGTESDGLYAFNGEEFRNYSIKDGLPDANINVIEEQLDYLVIGTSKGLCYFDGYRIITLNHSIHVNDLITYPDSSMWIGGNNGVLYFNKGIFSVPQHLEILKNQKVIHISTLEDEFFIATEKSLYTFGPQKLREISQYEQIEGMSLTSIAGSLNDVLWIGTKSNGLLRLYKDQVKSINLGSSNFRGEISDIEILENENLAITTDQNGLYIYDPIYENIEHYLERDGLPNDKLKVCLEDNWGNTWIGSTNVGLIKYYLAPFEKVGTQLGIPQNSISAILAESDSSIYFSHSSNQFSHFNGRRTKRFDENNGIEEFQVNSILKDSKNRIWIGTTFTGIKILENEKFHSILTNLDLSKLNVKDIIQDTSGRFYVATQSSGIIVIEESINEQFQFRSKSITLVNGMRDMNIRDLLLDNNGKVWFTTNSRGCGYLVDDSPVFITEDDGLLSNNTGVLACDSNDNIWVGFDQPGISIVNSDKFISVTNWTHIDTVPQGEIFQMIVTDQDVFVADNKTVFRYKIDKNEIVNGIHQYNTEDGIAGLIENPNSISKSANGNIYIGTNRGLVRLNSNELSKVNLEPKIHISDVQLFYNSIAETDYAAAFGSFYNQIKEVSFAHNENHLGFSFEGIDFNNRSHIKYQWKLEPYETGWSPLSNENQINYSNLNPGKYQFYCKAINDFGESISTPISFKIQKALWQRGYFIVGIGLILVAILFWLYRLRTNTIRSRAKRKNESLILENQLLSLEQKALQLQLNPHFIFNALNSIQGLIVEDKPQLARKQLNKFSSLMRSFLTQSRNTSIDLDDEIKSLKDYLELEQFSRSKNFDYEIQIDPQLDNQNYLIPPMMIQPFVENAIIHGINQLKKSGVIKLEFEIIGNKIKCVIDDNGVGRANTKNTNTPNHSSAATKVIQERLSILHQNSKLDVYKIIDKMDEEGNPSGTTVELLLPILN